MARRNDLIALLAIVVLVEMSPMASVSLSLSLSPYPSTLLVTALLGIHDYIDSICQVN